ncbi:hypothetical protein PY247_11315 [Acinetobacter proteolyticus]|nr:hypothetical protein [Acinetobacter proteolyticus]WEI17149.1 hypothetical protein PY247_11315 [Acinetobacter proteolyticus]
MILDFMRIGMNQRLSLSHLYKKIGKYDSNFVKTFRFICPNLEVSYDGNMAEIKSKDYQSILKNISEYDQYLDLYFYSFYKYPNIREGLITVDYAIGLKDFVIKSGIYLGFEGDNLDNISYTSNITKNTIIGYKVDNRELKPLLYDRKISRYKDDFDNASIIDIYHKVSKDEFGIGPNIQRIYINKVNGIMRIYQKYPFPSS